MCRKCECSPLGIAPTEVATGTGFSPARDRLAVKLPREEPHDLRHRRISLLHLRGEPWARIGEWVGQRNLAVTAHTYTHVLTDEAELDYEGLLRACTELTWRTSPLRNRSRDEDQCARIAIAELLASQHRQTPALPHRPPQVGSSSRKRPDSGQPKRERALANCVPLLRPRLRLGNPLCGHRFGCHDSRRRHSRLRRAVTPRSSLGHWWGRGPRLVDGASVNGTSRALAQPLGGAVPPSVPPRGSDDADLQGASSPVPPIFDRLRVSIAERKPVRWRGPASAGPLHLRCFVATAQPAAWTSTTEQRK
jgi:hypothetical protein